MGAAEVLVDVVEREQRGVERRRAPLDQQRLLLIPGAVERPKGKRLEQTLHAQGHGPVPIVGHGARPGGSIAQMIEPPCLGASGCFVTSSCRTLFSSLPLHTQQVPLPLHTEQVPFCRISLTGVCANLFSLPSNALLVQ